MISFELVARLEDLVERRTRIVLASVTCHQTFEFSASGSATNAPHSTTVPRTPAYLAVLQQT